MSELNTIDQAIDVLQAIKAGKDVQVSLGDNEWSGTVFVEIIPAFHANKYRVKPEPRRIWVNQYDPCGILAGSYLSLDSAISSAGLNCTGQVEFIEVIK